MCHLAEGLADVAALSARLPWRSMMLLDLRLFPGMAMKRDGEDEPSRWVRLIDCLHSSMLGWLGGVPRSGAADPRPRRSGALVVCCMAARDSRRWTLIVASRSRILLEHGGPEMSHNSKKEPRRGRQHAH